MTSPTVAAGQRHRERDALAVGDDVVLAARACAVDRAGSAFGPRRAARTWEESITALDQSSWFFERSLFSSSWWSWSQTPASFHAASRRQQVMPSSISGTVSSSLSLRIARQDILRVTVSSSLSPPSADRVALRGQAPRDRRQYFPMPMSPKPNKNSVQGVSIPGVGGRCRHPFMCSARDGHL